MQVLESGYHEGGVVLSFALGDQSLVVQYGKGGSWGIQEESEEPKKENRNLV